MKRRLIIGLIACMMCTLVACGNASTADTSKSDSGSKDTENSSTNTDENAQTENKEIEKEVETWNKTRIVNTTTYIQYPSNLVNSASDYWHTLREFSVNTDENKEYDTSYAIFIMGDKTSEEYGWYDSYNQYEGTLEDIIANLNPMKEYDMKYGGLLFGDFEAQEIKVQETELVKINDMEMLNFTGAVILNDLGEYSVYGYSFVSGGIPCVIYGVTSTQEPSLEKSVNETIDEIVKTVEFKE